MVTARTTGAISPASNSRRKIRQPHIVTRFSHLHIQTASEMMIGRRDERQETGGQRRHRGQGSDLRIKLMWSPRVTGLADGQQS